ncbi:esterase/lipase family protein [Tsuneonella mangrovi]|uniref:esterase/lipase family protein n=1 Tax=Tsuneonella mangrovi TaxID=1982042 RepID=UPI000BA23B14|nr:alpha/beta hydrolase [Tsuneonella mangrovi]
MGEVASRFRNLQLAETRAEVLRRLELAAEPAPRDIGGPSWRLMLGELSALAEPIRRQFRHTEIARTATPRTVMLLPGFATHPIRMRYLAHQLERAGHTVKRWGLGFNLGPSVENLALLEGRLESLAARAGEPVYLVGWSLGGLFARELAKRRPELVAKVVTMGSPFSYNPRANNAWRAYHLVAGHRVEEPPVQADLAAKPPVETVALWSPRDGIVHPRAARGLPGERDREVALRCTHLGFAWDPEAVAAILRELEPS